MNLFSDKVCPSRHATQCLVSTIWPSSNEKSEQAASSIPISEHYSFEIFQRVEDLPPAWDQLLRQGNIFLQTAFLAALQSSPPKGMQNRYMLIYREGRPVGVTLLQLIDYKLKESLKELSNGEMQGWQQKLRYRLAGVLNFKLLVVGNLLLSGEHAFSFDEDVLTGKEGLKLILDALPLVKGDVERREGQRLSGVLLKDLAAPLDMEHRQGLMHQVTFQPNMRLPLSSAWQSMDAYLGDLQSKYRVRARRAFKKAKGVQIREWELEEIIAKKELLHTLYESVADKANFNMLHLQLGYFPALKEALGEDFRLFGYEDQKGELLGFCTLIQNGSDYDAHFLGLEEEANRQRQLYLNMLFDMLKHAIENPAIKTIIFGRTALEIKSSVGAVPQAMYCYAKHFNPIFNLIIGWLIRKYDPVEEWQPRHPFKTVAMAQAILLDKFGLSDES